MREGIVSRRSRRYIIVISMNFLFPGIITSFSIITSNDEIMGVKIGK